MELVTVIDYGMGNLRSVHKALEHVAGATTKVVVTSDPVTIRDADRVVFPGQGAIRDAMRELSRLGLTEVLPEVIHDRPFLGICLGLQALMEHSEESSQTNALGLIAGSVVKFDTRPPCGPRLKVPHMGWNTVDQVHDHPLWAGIKNHTHFYFVHSYYVVPADTQQVAATTHYGVDFACALFGERLFAVQFHPEKSQADGLRLLQNFLQWRPGP